MDQAAGLIALLAEHAASTALALALLLVMLADSLLRRRQAREAELIEDIDMHPNSAVFPTELGAESGGAARRLRRLRAAGVLAANRQGAVMLQPSAWTQRQRRYRRCRVLLWLLALALATGLLSTLF